MKLLKEIFEKKLKLLEELPLAKDDYAITGSGPLAIRGLREANDIDLLVTDTIWEKLAKKHLPASDNMIQFGQIEIWRNYLNLSKRMDEVMANREWISNYPFVSLIDTLSWKRYLNRAKDQDDIALIENFLNQ